MTTTMHWHHSIKVGTREWAIIIVGPNNSGIIKCPRVKHVYPYHGIRFGMTLVHWLSSRRTLWIVWWTTGSHSCATCCYRQSVFAATIRLSLHPQLNDNNDKINDILPCRFTIADLETQSIANRILIAAVTIQVVVVSECSVCSKYTTIKTLDLPHGCFLFVSLHCIHSYHGKLFLVLQFEKWLKILKRIDCLL